MSDSESSIDENLPSASECEERCQRFAEVTGTDTALAMFYLQDREWNLDRALNSFFEDGQSSAQQNAMKIADAEVKIDQNKNANQSSSREKDCVQKEEKDTEPHRIRLMSWNIDGLDTSSLKSRAQAVVQTVKSDKPHVLFVQEMVPDNEVVLRTGLNDYTCITCGSGQKEGYYTGLFLHKLHTILDQHQIVPFFSSKMGRNLLIASCTVKGVPLTLMTSHLESTKTHSAERKRQLSAAFKHMSEAAPNQTVIFGGDLNLRDKELESIGGIPSGLYDLWEATGRRKEAQYTWDTFHNDNLGFEGRMRSHHRFDRLYLRHSSPQAKLKPVYFELIGLQRIPGIQRFPSDHWGILAHFDINT